MTKDLDQLFHEFEHADHELRTAQVNYQNAQVDLKRELMRADMEHCLTINKAMVRRYLGKNK